MGLFLQNDYGRVEKLGPATLYNAMCAALTKHNAEGLTIDSIVEQIVCQNKRFRQGKLNHPHTPHMPCHALSCIPFHALFSFFLPLNYFSFIYPPLFFLDCSVILSVLKMKAGDVIWGHVRTSFACFFKQHSCNLIDTLTYVKTRCPALHAELLSMDAPEPEHVSAEQFLNQDATSKPIQFTKKGLNFLQSFGTEQLREVIKSLGLTNVQPNADSVIAYLCTAGNVFTRKALTAQLTPTFVNQLNKERFDETQRWRKVLAKLQPIEDQTLWPKMNRECIEEYFKDDGSTRQGGLLPQHYVYLNVSMQVYDQSIIQFVT